VNLDTQAWLDANTFQCERLRARITPAQCEANRSRPEGAVWVDDNGPGPTLHPACKDCPRAAEPPQPKEKTVAKEKGLCACCGLEGAIIAKGLESRCYKMSLRGDIKPRPDGGWDVVSDEALERINEARLSSGLTERGKSASEIAAQAGLDAVDRARMEAAQRKCVDEAENPPKEKAPAAAEPVPPTGKGKPPYAKQLAAFGRDFPPEVLELDGLALPLVTNDRTQHEDPYLLVTKSLDSLEVPASLSRLMPQDASAVFLYADKGKSRIYLVPTAMANKHARPMCAKKKGAGRQVYCKKLLTHLGIKPGHYPAEPRDNGVIVVRLDKELAA